MLGVVAVFAALNLTLLLNPLYLQHTRGWTPLAAGIATLPMAFGATGFAPPSGKLVGRLGPRRPLFLAGAFIAAGGLSLADLGPRTNVALLLLAYLLIGTRRGAKMGRMAGSTSLWLIREDQQRQAAARLWQLYTHDLSEFRGSMPDGEGLFKPGRFPSFFGDPDRCGYLIYAGQALAGFAFVRGLSAEPRVVGEFFVVRAARRDRVGYEAAMELLRLHRGRWEIAFQEENPGAARFWRRVAADVADLTGAAGAVVKEERRPVPGKPEIPPDTWLLLGS